MSTGRGKEVVKKKNNAESWVTNNVGSSRTHEWAPCTAGRSSEKRGRERGEKVRKIVDKRAIINRGKRGERGP